MEADQNLSTNIHKQYQNLYFARLADSCSRYQEALSLIQLHFLQGFDPQKPLNLQQQFSNKSQSQKQIRFENEEIELYITICKNYFSQERKSIKKLSTVEAKLENRVIKQSEKLQGKSTERLSSNNQSQLQLKLSPDQIKLKATLKNIYKKYTIIQEKMSMSNVFKTCVCIFSQITSWYYQKVESSLKEWINKILIQVDYMLLPMINQKFLNLQEDIENRKNPDKSDQNTNFQNFSQDLMQNEVDDDGGPMSMFAVKKLEDLFTVEKIMCLRFRGDLYRYQSDIMTGFDQKQSIENALQSYQQAAGECCKISSCHVICLKLALSHAVYYCQINLVYYNNIECIYIYLKIIFREKIYNFI